MAGGGKGRHAGTNIISIHLNASPPPSHSNIVGCLMCCLLTPLPEIPIMFVRYVALRCVRSVLAAEQTQKDDLKSEYRQRYIPTLDSVQWLSLRILLSIRRVLLILFAHSHYCTSCHHHDTIQTHIAADASVPHYMATPIPTTLRTSSRNERVGPVVNAMSRWTCLWSMVPS